MLLRLSFSSYNIGPCLITLDIFIGLRWVLVAVLGTGEATATLTAVKGLVGADLYDLNGGLVAGKFDVLGLAQSWNCLLIFFILASISQSNRIRSLRFFAFLMVTYRFWNSLLNFSYNMTNTWESSILAFLDSSKKVFKNTSKSLLVW